MISSARYAHDAINVHTPYVRGEAYANKKDVIPNDPLNNRVARMISSSSFLSLNLTATRAAAAERRLIPRDEQQQLPSTFPSDVI